MKQQRGGFFLGMIVGLLVGLALALGVALYVTKVPVPFINKVPSRTAEQDAAEAERNRNWDPNTALHGKNPARPAPAASAPVAAPASEASSEVPAAQPPAASESAASAAAAASSPVPPGLRPPRPESRRDPAAILSGASTAGSSDTVYFVQAGAYSRAEEAEQQRAKLAMLGFGAQVSEREQTGRTVYRVRLGPFGDQDQAESAKDKLSGSGVEAALVRVQR